MSLITIVQEVAGALNQPVPTAVFGSSTGDAVLWRNLAQREGRELAKRHDWQAMIVQQTWTTTATQAQSTALPSAYDHLPPDVEIWDQTGKMPLAGPTSSRDWQILTSRAITGGLTGWWRIIGGVLNIYPAPAAGRTYALEYISKNWCQSSGSTAQSAWAADSDTALIPENLIALGITWRWLRAKGMAYAEEMSTYEREVEKAAGRDRGSNTLVVGGSQRADLTPTWNGIITP
jgi:hypothetical protein